MKLNEKYEKISDRLEKFIDTLPDDDRIFFGSLIGVVLRQILELHQKMDEVLELARPAKFQDSLAQKELRDSAPYRRSEG